VLRGSAGRRGDATSIARGALEAWPRFFAAAFFSLQGEWAYSIVQTSGQIAARIESRYNRIAAQNLHSPAQFESEARVIVGLGLDIAEIDRIEAALSRHGAPILERLYTPAEVAYCESFRGKFERYAGRFAAKEAAMKALGTGWRSGIRWRDIEVMREPSGKPSLRLHGVAGQVAERLGVKNISLTITHSGNLALAEVIFEN
jgi:holo-[acyl-carrier protein] synthase